MVNDHLDFNDAVISPAFVIAAAVDTGLLNMSIFGFDFASELFGGGLTSISAASIIGVLTLLVAFATNRPNFNALGAMETWVAVVTIVLTIATPVVPILQWLLGHTIAALIATIVQAAGFYVLAYLG